MSNNLPDNKMKKLGFGFMRLPKKNGEFDTEQINKMVDLYMENGGTYFDTAYLYDGSEAALREALVKRYPREKFQIATKLQMRMANNRAEMEEQFQISSERLGVDYIDTYMLHGIDAKVSAKSEETGAWAYLAELKAQGKIRRMGFSFHGTVSDLDEILSKHPEAEFVQLQINYLDWSSERVQSKLLYETARKHNTPIIIMEPVKGGLLTGDDSPIAGLLHDANPNVSMASWAMRFAGQLDGVVTVLSGMSSLEQMTDNMGVFKNFTPLSDEEAAVLEKAAGIINAIPRVACTSCGYCLEGCPAKILIPNLIRAYNNYLVYNTINNVDHEYAIWTKRSGTAADCTHCGACEDICPQKLDITGALEKLTALFHK